MRTSRRLFRGWSWRTPVTAVVATVVVVPAAVVLPTVSRPLAAPRAVTPQLHTLALSGVDPAALAATPQPRFLAAELAGRTGTSRSLAERRVVADGPRVLTAPVATRSFQTFAVTWLPTVGPRARRDLVVSARYRRTDGGWSSWVDLGGPNGDTADGPEAVGAARAGTEPYYTGPADGVQVRVDTADPQAPLPSGLRVDLIDPGTSPADAAVTAPDPISSAAAGATDPNIITRAEWGADESLKNGAVPQTTTYKVAFVHHTAGTNDYTRAEGPAQVRGLYAYYVNSLGYSDMGYNFLVDKYGQIYEGRTGSIDGFPRDAATGGFNTDTMAVSTLGNFSTAPAPPAMVAAVGRIIGYRLAKVHADPMGHQTLVAEDGSYKYAPGTKVTFDVISGHRDASATACPGAKLYPKLPEIRRVAKQWMGANLVQPRMTGAVTQLGAVPDVSVRSGVLQDQSWQLQISDACTGQVVRTVNGSASPSAPIAVTWRGRDDSGGLVPAGRYVVRLTSQNASGRSVPWVGGPTVGETPSAAAPRRGIAARPAGRFVAVDQRLLARTSTGAGLTAAQVVGPGDRLVVPTLGHAGIPASGVTAVAVTVTTSCASRRTTVSAVPARVAGRGGPVVTARPAATTVGTAVVPVGVDGAIGLVNAAGWVNLTVTVAGYWTTHADPGLGMRSVVQPLGGVSVGPSATTVPVAGQGSVLADASAAVLTLRAGPRNTATALTVWPADQAKPAQPNVVLRPGSSSSARVLVGLGNGAVRIAADHTTSVAVDVDAQLAATIPSVMHALSPRTLTSPAVRIGTGSIRLPVLGRGGVPAQGVRAVVLQVHAARASASTALTVWPATRPQPDQPDVVVARHGAADTFVVVPVGPRGAVRVGNRAGAVTTSVSVVGWVG